MKNYLLCIALGLMMIWGVYSFGEKQAETPVMSAEERREFSECVARVIWSHLDTYAPYYDFNIVIEKLEEFAHSNSPPMTPDQCRLEVFFPLLKKINDYNAITNLKEAEVFFADLIKRKEIQELVKGRLYYEILETGNGLSINSEDSPILDFDEWLQGEVLMSSQRAAKITLAYTIKGFADGVAGMREGERRKIYVHPDLAYGKLGTSAPQQYVIYEVKAVQAR